MVNSQSTLFEQSGSVNGSFDLETAIANLICGADSNSIELPSCLTPEQRKQARLVADQHPELKCESYGFGADRRLHVFKRSATTCVRVKNTFVEGWASNDVDDDGRDAIIFRSMPVNLREHAQLCSAGRGGDGKLELPPLSLYTKSFQERRLQRGDSTSSGSTSVLQDIFSEGEEVTPESRPDSPMPDTCLEGEATPDIFSEGEDLPASPLHRISTEAEVPLSSRPEPPAFPPGNFDQFALGTMVVIQGLVRAPAFNGRIGVIHALDPKTYRYDVLLASPSGGQQWTKVKYANLRPVPSSSDNETILSATAA